MSFWRPDHLGLTFWGRCWPARPHVTVVRSCSASNLIGKKSGPEGDIGCQLSGPPDARPDSRGSGRGSSGWQFMLQAAQVPARVPNCPLSIDRGGLLQQPTDCGEGSAE